MTGSAAGAGARPSLSGGGRASPTAPGLWGFHISDGAEEGADGEGEGEEGRWRGVVEEEGKRVEKRGRGREEEEQMRRRSGGNEMQKRDMTGSEVGQKMER